MKGFLGLNPFGGEPITDNGLLGADVVPLDVAIIDRTKTVCDSDPFSWCCCFSSCCCGGDSKRG